jgi:hypothetical protein
LALFLIQDGICVVLGDGVVGTVGVGCVGVGGIVVGVVGVAVGFVYVTVLESIGMLFLQY